MRGEWLAGCGWVACVQILQAGAVKPGGLKSIAGKHICITIQVRTRVYARAHTCMHAMRACVQGGGVSWLAVHMQASGRGEQ